MLFRFLALRLISPLWRHGMRVETAMGIGVGVGVGRGRNGKHKADG